MQLPSSCSIWILSSLLVADRSFLESRLDLVSLVRIHEENGRGRKAKGISKDSVERSLQRSKRPQGVR